jgi:leucyl/phenylalanyl-tRNA--protein transferase
MAIPWLVGNTPFPSVETALHSPNGLLAVSESLSAERILRAYQQGIFPWFSPDDPVLWWSPDPRMVLIPQQFKHHRSLQQAQRQCEQQTAQGIAHWQLCFDRDFAGVMRACAQQKREGQDGTWIVPMMIEAYCQLHAQGYAHSFELWRDEVLVAGGYGVAIGRMFYGESMFTHVTNGSKMALAHLVKWLDAQGCTLIDCQQYTPHLASLGGQLIPRSDFVVHVQQAITQPSMAWSHDRRIV